MKKMTMLQRWALLFLVLASMAFSPADRDDDCQLSVQRMVDFGFHQGGPANNPKMVQGQLELCVDQEGNCTWMFNEHLVKVPALEHLVKLVFTSGMTTEEYIASVRKKGGSITDIGNQTLSVTEENTSKGLTIITLVDVEREVILGSNVYQNSDELTTKVICKYEGGNKQSPHLQSLSLLIWKGNALTEMVFENF